MLENRFNRCERMRHRIENIVAVDFFTRDVAELVDRLNDHGAPAGVLATSS
jgi:hypothetical protein